MRWLPVLVVAVALNAFGFLLLAWWAVRGLPWGWPLFAVLAVLAVVFGVAVWRGRADGLDDDWR